MTPLATVGPPLGLQETSADMSPEQRCSIGIRNIELLCDLDWRGRLLLGAELSRMKWSGDFTRDDDVWRPDETARNWDEWLKRRDFRLEGGEKAMGDETANTLIMWSVLTPTLLPSTSNGQSKACCHCRCPPASASCVPISQ